MRQPDTSTPLTDRSRRPLPRAEYDALATIIRAPALIRLALWLYARTLGVGVDRYSISDAVLRRVLHVSEHTIIRFRRAMIAAGLAEVTSDRMGTEYRVLCWPTEARRRLYPAQPRPDQLIADPPDRAPGTAPHGAPEAAPPRAPTPTYTRAIPAGTPDPDTRTALDHHQHPPDGAGGQLSPKPSISSELLDRLRRIRWHGDPSRLSTDQIARLPQHLADAERDGRDPARLLSFRLAHDLGPGGDGPMQSQPSHRSRPTNLSRELAVGRPSSGAMMAHRPECTIDIDAIDAYAAATRRYIDAIAAPGRDALLAEVRAQWPGYQWEWAGHMVHATYEAAGAILVRRGEWTSCDAWCAARDPARHTAIAGSDQRRAS